MAKKKEEIVPIEQIIVDADFKDVMEDSYLNYSLEVLLSRAVPDIRDGFKPVQRRIVYDMNELKVYYNSQYKKCGRIVGDTMGKYHPHGDSSIYEALVRIAQSWQLNIPLIDGHGKKTLIKK
jgi:DNA gyrase subunit A